MWPDMKMDVREMSGFESGSFDAIVDKGLLLFYFFSFFYFLWECMLDHFRIKSSIGMCCWKHLKTVAYTFLQWKSRNFGLYLGEYFWGNVYFLSRGDCLFKYLCAVWAEFNGKCWEDAQGGHQVYESWYFLYTWCFWFLLLFDLFTYLIGWWQTIGSSRIKAYTSW